MTERSAIDVFCGDPIFAGLHHDEEIADGRSYRDTSHALYPYHLALPKAERKMTVVLAGNWDWYTVVHEVGHMVHWLLNLERFPFPNVSAYAATDRYENFAEAFSTYCFAHVPRYAEAHLGLHKLGRGDLRLLDALVARI